MYSPLEQFEVNGLISVAFPAGTLGQPLVINIVTNASLFLLLAVLSFAVLCSYPRAGNQLVPGASAQACSELLIGFVAGLVKENTAGRHKILLVFVPYVLCAFFLVLSSNFVGMVPYSFTVTSSLAATFSIALASFVGINIIGARIHRMGFLAIFLPPGCPPAISPFIILIETVSYVARVFSLSIRLFANMMAGHTLLKILAGFA